MGATKKLRVVLALSLFLALYITLCSYAATNPINGSIITSGVRIELNKYTLNASNNRVTATDISNLQPNEVVNYIVNVSNKKAPAYVRIRIDYDSSFPVDDSLIMDIQPNWVKRGNYYYYKQPLGTNESVDLFTKIRVPNLATSEGDYFTIIANADAVQSANFTPDFNSTNPWGGILIESTNGDGEYTESGDEGGFTLHFNNGLEGVFNKTDIFDDFGTVMPGDELTDSLTVVNAMYQDLRITLKSVNNPVNTDAWEGKINLRIKRGNNILYDGYLFDAQIKKGINLGAFDRGTTEKIDFEITLSPDLRNNSSFSILNVEWDLNATFYTKGGNGKGGHVTPGKNGGGNPNLIEPSKLKELDMTEIGYMEPVTTANTRRISGGKWVLIDPKHHKWNYVFTSGNLAKDGWFFLENPYAKDLYGEYAWFKFDQKGVMEFGWIQHELNPEIWYYAHEFNDGNFGVLMKGWHHDPQDGKIYYLDPTTYVMKQGLQTIDGKQYYFHMRKDTEAQHWSFGLSIDAITNSHVYKWFYTLLGGRSYGTMYQNENIPDGRWADENGVIRTKR